MTTPERFSVLAGGASVEDREARLTEGADDLSLRTRWSMFGQERLLLTVAGALMTLGVSIILLGWFGAAHTTHVEEQVPYLISGGVLGLALAIIGALCLFTHWSTVRIREARDHEAARREDHDELMDALRSVATALAHQEETANGRAGGAQPRRPIRRAPRSS